MKKPVVAGIVLVLVAAGIIYVATRPKTPAPIAADRAAAGQLAPQRPAGEKGPAVRAPQEQDLLLDDDRPGTLQLEGIVLGPDDQPVGGAEVTVSSAPARTVTTEANGTFTVEGLLARRYTVVARADAGVGGPVQATLSGKSEMLTIRLQPGASLSVTVKVAGQVVPVAGAQVELRDIETQTATTGPDGVAHFKNVAPGRYDLVASLAGYARAYDGVSIPRSAEAQVTASLELRPGAAVAGTVRDERGAPVEGALVTFQGVSEWMSSADPRRDAIRTGKDGAYRFDALPAGSFRIAARHATLAPGQSPPLTLDGKTERSGVDLVLPPGAVIAGKVVDKAGQPAPLAAVRVVVKVQGWGFEPARQVTADETGHFEMTGLPRKPLQVVAVGDGAASPTVDVDLSTKAEARDLTITLSADGSISGLVVDDQGQPIADAQVWAMPDFRRGDRAARMEFRLRGGISELTDQGGRFVLRGVGEGNYMLRASRPGKSRNFMTEGVGAAAGDKDVKITLPEEGGVKGKVLLPDGNAPGSFTVGVAMGPPTPFASGDGAFVLGDLPPGDLRLTISGPSFAPKVLNVKIETGKVADLGTINVAPGRKISGTVVDASGKPVAGATVYAARRLMGTGGSVASQGMGFGPGGGEPARTATTDERGVFVINGVPPRDVSILADHETAGRSAMQVVPGSTEDSTVQLTLAAPGALEGTVSKDGKPVEGVGISVVPQSAPNTTFIVATGADGRFRYDRLAADSYLVQAIGGGNPMAGMQFHTKTVVVQPGKVASVSIDMPTGATIVAQPKLADGGNLNICLVRVTMGKVAAQNARDLNLEIARKGEKFSSFSVALMGNPATVPDVPAGDISVCGIPLPAEVRGMRASFEYIEREGDNLPVVCVPAKATGTGQIPVALTIPRLPAFVPPPPEENK